MQNFNNQKLSISLWYKNKNNENEVIVYTGIIRRNKGTYYLHRGKGYKNVKILNDWIQRIKKIENKEIRKILLGADYSLSLSVGDLPNNSINNEFISVGLKWTES